MAWINRELIIGSVSKAFALKSLTKTDRAELVVISAHKALDTKTVRPEPVEG